MADKYDDYLREYHTGGLDLLIENRKQDLRMSKEPDENIGGGRAQNSKVNRTELELMAFEEDDQIQEWEKRKRVIKTCLKNFSENELMMFKLRYRGKATWAEVEAITKIQERTGQRVCQKLRTAISKHLN